VTGLGTTVINKTLPSFGSVAAILGTAGVVGEADYGPEGPTLIRSIQQWVETYGAYSSTSATSYNWANSFFARGGRRLYFQRPSNGGAAAAKEELATAGEPKVLVITAKYKGSGGNSYKIAVIENAGKTKTKLVVYGPEGEVLQESGEYAKAEELLKWGEEEAHKTYILITAGANYTAGKAELVKALASKALAGGTNPTALTAAELVAGLAAFTRNLGPMYVAIPANTEETTHKGLAEHAANHEDRYAVGDFTDSATPATLIAAKGVSSLSSAYQGCIAFTSSTAIVPGPTPGSTVKVQGSSLFCALHAEAAATGNLNQATAGFRWPVSPNVIGFTNTFTHTQQEQLVEGGINVWGEELGQLCLIGYVSAVNREVDEIFWSAAAGAERMALDYEGGIILAEAANNQTIDGQHHLIAIVEGRLQGLIKRHFESGALYGEQATGGPTAAGSVEMGEPINTPASIQKGELNAELQVRISEYAQATTLTIVSRPITANVSE
jgi:hypothetical protein